MLADLQSQLDVIVEPRAFFQRVKDKGPVVLIVAQHVIFRQQGAAVVIAARIIPKDMVDWVSQNSLRFSQKICPRRGDREHDVGHTLAIQEDVKPSRWIALLTTVPIHFGEQNVGLQRVFSGNMSLVLPCLWVDLVSHHE